MQSLGFESKNPTIFNMIADLESEGREIDFVVFRNKKALFAVECRTGEKHISPHIRYFRSRTDIPFFYQIHLGKDDWQEENIRVLPFETFCRAEKMP